MTTHHKKINQFCTACNRDPALFLTDSISSTTWSRVTCKNCLRTKEGKKAMAKIEASSKNDELHQFSLFFKEGICTEKFQSILKYVTIGLSDARLLLLEKLKNDKNDRFLCWDLDNDGFVLVTVQVAQVEIVPN